MAFKSLSHFIQALEANRELVRIREYVSPNLEITEIADRMVKNGGRALLFENTGTQFPLLINAFASDRRICLALGVNSLADIETDLARLMKDILGPRASFLDKLKLLPTLQEVASWMPKSVSRRGACQEIVMDKPDLTKIPVLTCWPADGGPFITLPGVHTVDPQTGMRNLGMYRMQVFSPEMTGMHWHLHKGSARHYHQYKAMGKRMPVSVTLGGDPVYTYAATAPLPENLDEYLLAGFLRKKKVELVKCLTNNLEVPSDVDFVIEGYVDPGEELILEGPFGDHTGYYSLADYYPRFHVTCITHRKNAVYPATIVGIPPQEDGWIGKATERIFLMPIRMTVAPEVTGMHMPVEGVFHNITLVSINKEYPGQAIKIISSLWGAGQMMFNKIMAVTDKEVELTDYLELAKTISANVDPVSDIHFLRGPVDILDHASSRFAYGSKMGIDATRKFPQELNDLLPLPPSPSRGGDGGEVFSPDLQKLFPEIRGIRSDLPGRGISLVIVAVRKSKKHHIHSLAAELLGKGHIAGVKFILFVDDLLNLASLSQLVWISANNLDPIRDCFYIDAEPGVKIPALCMDATRKTREFDDFQRDWPNVIVMDDQTIRAVDEKWPRLELGPLIPSPSIEYKSLVVSSGAVSREKN
ncbi:MAG: menaquinone biosynthesis decarboxylase [Bacteroidetes bacterium]|nr:menaquinone biosynthesis decarboxylase [Bacteroidota bacterium]